ncbi:MAG TPA: ribosome biogenesis GTP-binding protein YihA/YsxC [Magnetospirillum sp.]|nr:ribosome biogenesis GTP-binding protein YihA/YsxC [Magnetospirillum sp.]
MSGNPHDEAAAGPTDQELIEAGRLLFAREVTFMRGVAALDGLPPISLPEIAFAGRSNVGKSSLINALCGRSTVARTSNTPGRTQELNYFDVSGRLILVDMPGYGFAKAPKDKVDAWKRLVNGYLRGRPTLRRCMMLVDSRHGLKDVDREIMTMLDKAAVVYQIVLTKIDKLNATEAAAVEARTREEIVKRVAAHPTLILTSSEKGLGIPELRAEILQLANPE